MDIHQTINSCIEAVWPWLDKKDSVGDSWTWTKEDTLERGYGTDDPDRLAGCVGFEDAVYLFEDRDRLCMYTEMELLQAEIDRRKLPYWLEPHYSFLWMIWSRESEAYNG